MAFSPSEPQRDTCFGCGATTSSPSSRGLIHARSAFILPEIAEYLRAHTTPPTPAQEKARDEIHRQDPDAVYHAIGDDQALLLEILTSVTRTRRALELGTGSGYATLSLARGVGEHGQVVTCDIEQKRLDRAAVIWQGAGVAERIVAFCGPAEALLQEGNTPYGLAFIDADKEGTLTYVNALLDGKLTEGGLIVVDNTLYLGLVLEPGAATTSATAPIARPDYWKRERDYRAEAAIFREFNRAIKNDPRAKVLPLPIGDGLTIIQKVSHSIR